MTPPLSDELLSHFSDFIAGQMGLHFPKERWRDLERGIRIAARQAGASNAESYVNQLLAGRLDKTHIELLASELTVGETYFFRDKRSFEILEGKILPELIRSKQNGERHLRIWSAGCCTGEEPYSIAILLDRMFPGLSSWNVTILGTDINPHFLRKAAEGVYSDWSFRDAPPWLKENYFRQTGRNRFEILPRIQKMVSFSCLNLAEDNFPSLSNNTNAMDLIFCRNVLMYFAPGRAGKTIQNFHRALMDDGCLIVSMTETSSGLFAPFVAEHLDGVVIYRKTDKPPATVPAFQPAFLPPKPEKEIDSPPVFFVPPKIDSPPVEQPPIAAVETNSLEEALILFEQGHYAEAIQKLKSDPAQLESSPEATALLARACANLGELVEAREWAEKAIALDKVNAGLRYLRAVILQEQGETEEAAQTLKRALYLDPDFVVAHFALGNHALRQHKFGEVDKHFSNALALLNRYEPDEPLPDSDGLLAGRLRELIESTMAVEKVA